MRASAALALASAGALFAAAPAAAQDHSARVDRFLAALPPSQDKGDSAPDADDAAETDRLIAANPGKEAAIREARTARDKCISDFSSGFAMRSLRKAADALTDTELDQLTAFYSGPDFARSEHATEAEQKALLDRYPLRRFMEVSQKVAADMPEEGFAGFAACDAAVEASLSAAGVKVD